MNKKNAPKSKSLSKKLIVPLACMMFMQGVLYLSAILGAGTLRELNHNALQLFDHGIEYRSEGIQSYMVKRWAFSDYFNDILQTAKQELDNNGTKVNTVSYTMANQLEILLRNSNSTGAFVIYENEIKDNKYTSFYIRDMEPTVYSKNDSDLLVSFGSGKLASEMGLAMDYDWTNDFVMTDDDDFYIYSQEIQKEANKETKLSSNDLGRWSGKLKMSATAQDVIVYTMPLLDQQHHMYGLVGIEVSMDYLDTFLPYEELTMDGMGAYVLGILQSDGSYKTVTQNSLYYDNLESEKSLTLSKVSDKLFDIYATKDKFGNDILASVKPLKLYNSNTPFESEQWALIGLASKSTLLASGIRLQWLLFWACIGALLVGAISSVVSALIFSRPIKSMVKELQLGGNDDGIYLKRTYVTEIDSLAIAVEKYSSDVAESASRLSQILHIMNQPLGAIEVDKQNDTVYCTGLVGELLNFTEPNQKRLKFTMAEFGLEIENFKAHTIDYNNDYWPDIENEDGTQEQIVKCKRENKEVYWVSFKTVVQQQRELTVVQDLTSEVNEKIKIEYERDYDLLTNLLNRRSFRKRVLRLMDSTQTKGIGAMVMWDLDNLKTINDTYGHDFGDTYICEAAKILQSLTSEHAVVSRMSGDEFLVYFHNLPSKNYILSLVQSAHKQLRNTILWLPGGDSVTIRASVGVVWNINKQSSFEELLKYADFAMYSAKDNVKGTMQEFDSDKYTKEAILFNSKDELKRFIEEKQMRFQFQPIVESRTGKVFAYEALMRPYGDKITSIVEMMHLAKAQGKLQQIEFMTFMGVMEAYHWQRDAFGEVKLFFNSIASSRLSMEDFAAFKRRFGNDLHRLVIEITQDEQKNEDCLYFKQSHLKSWGLQLAIDDFGSKQIDQSLKKLSPQYIKLNMSLVRNIDNIEIHQTKVAEILAFAKPRNILTIAVGVETQEEMEILQGLGVDFLQGFYIGKPDYEVQGISKSKQKEISSFFKFTI